MPESMQNSQKLNNDNMAVDTVDHCRRVSKPTEDIISQVSESLSKQLSVKIPEIKQVSVENKIDFYYDLVELSETREYSMEVCHFESVHNFWAQILDRFIEFDEMYEEFQKECEQSKLNLTKEKLGN